MKTTTVLKVIAIGLVLIFTIGPAAASTFGVLDGSVQSKTYSRESAKLSGFMSSPQYTLLEPRLTKPDLTLFPGGMPKTDLIQIDVPEKDLWRELPTTGPYCSSCGFKNATYSFGAMFVEDYVSPMPGFYFGGGGGAGAPAGGGCCG